MLENRTHNQAASSTYKPMWLTLKLGLGLVLSVASCTNKNMSKIEELEVWQDTGQTLVNGHLGMEFSMENAVIWPCQTGMQNRVARSQELPCVRGSSSYLGSSQTRTWDHEASFKKTLTGQTNIKPYHHILRFHVFLCRTKDAQVRCKCGAGYAFDPSPNGPYTSHCWCEWNSQQWKGHPRSPSCLPPVGGTGNQWFWFYGSWIWICYYNYNIINHQSWIISNFGIESYRIIHTCYSIAYHIKSKKYYRLQDYRISLVNYIRNQKIINYNYKFINLI